MFVSFVNGDTSSKHMQNLNRLRRTSMVIDYGASYRRYVCIIHANLSSIMPIPSYRMKFRVAHAQTKPSLKQTARRVVKIVAYGSYNGAELPMITVTSCI